MSWKESDRVSERLEFVKLAAVEGANIAALCRRFGVSRKTGYKWLQRFNDDGKVGLQDKSRKPACSPGKTCDEIEKLVVDLRQQHPAWGGRTLRKRLEVLGHKDLPSPSTNLPEVRQSPRFGSTSTSQRARGRLLYDR